MRSCDRFVSRYSVEVNFLHIVTWTSPLKKSRITLFENVHDALMPWSIRLNWCQNIFKQKDGTWHTKPRRHPPSAMFCRGWYSPMGNERGCYSPFHIWSDCIQMVFMRYSQCMLGAAMMLTVEDCNSWCGMKTFSNFDHNDQLSFRQKCEKFLHSGARVDVSNGWCYTGPDPRTWFSWVLRVSIWCIGGATHPAAQYN